MGLIAHLKTETITSPLPTFQVKKICFLHFFQLNNNKILCNYIQMQYTCLHKKCIVFQIINHFGILMLPWPWPLNQWPWTIHQCDRYINTYNFPIYMPIQKVYSFPDNKPFWYSYASVTLTFEPMTMSNISMQSLYQYLQFSNIHAYTKSVLFSR